MEKFGRNYKIIFTIGQRSDDLLHYDVEEIIEVAYPYTLKFQTSNGVNYSQVGSCHLQLYNLAENIQYKLHKDNYDNKKFILIKLYAGYKDNMPLIFEGFATQSYSFRESGAVDYITDIQADNTTIINLNYTNVTFSKDTNFDDVLKMILKDIPNYQVGYTTPNIKPLPRNRTFIGKTLDLLGQEYGAYDIFIDNNELNIVDKNEVIPGDILVLTAESGLLGSPRRANAFLMCELIFEPQLKLAQAIELRSESIAWFNQIYRVIAIEHQGTISPVECGTLTTRVTLSLGDDPFTLLQKSTGNTYGGQPTTGVWDKPVKVGFQRISEQFMALRGNRNHAGIDIAAVNNSPVYAPANGRITFANWNGGYGKCIQMDNGKIDGVQLTSLYGHLNSFVVSPNQNVYKGDLIGYVGSTGRSTGPHLHMEVRKNGTLVNPLNYIGSY